MSRILITGGFGFVGGRLTRRLAEDHEVWVSSRNKPADTVLRLHGNVRRFDHALLLRQDTFPAFIDTVIHLAALNEIDSEKFPSEAIRVNVDETRMVLENSIAQKVTRFIYFSTAHIYGAPLQGRLTEDRLPVPEHPYAITHRSAEDYVVAAARKERIAATVFRLSNAFGAPVTANVNRWSLLVNDLGRQAVEKGRVRLRSNGCQYRDFICLSDVENLISDVLTGGKLPREIIYNLGSGSSMQVRNMADRIAQTASRILKKTIAVEMPAGSTASEEPQFHYAIDRLLQEGYLIRNDLNAELEKLLIFCKENFSNP